MKRRIIVIVVLALLAGILPIAASSTPAVHAQSGLVQGAVYWIDMYGNLQAMPWAQITAEDGAHPTVVTYTTNGTYVMWLPEGVYDITASSPPGFFPETITSVVVSPGTSTSLDFTLKPTGEPIPELPPWAQPLMLLGAMTITVLALRRYRGRRPT